MIINILIDIIWLLVPILICATYLVYAERRIIGFMQLRIGPNTVGPFGLLQPLADAIKLATKEFILPSNIKTGGFLLAPVITFSLALAGWAVIPTKFTANAAKLEYLAYAVAEVNFGVMYFMLISGIGVYGIVIAGWASGSHYAFLGSMRAVAQMISYELVMGTAIASVVLCTGSFNFLEIVDKAHNLPTLTKLLLVPMAVIFFIAILAETKRHPFDLPEAESELVAGYNVEYSSMPFAMFFFGEYANMILTSAVMVLLFMGGWHPPLTIHFLYYFPGLLWFGLKIFGVLFCFVWVRSTLPRYRYDQLMRLCWARLLPLSFLWLLLIAFLLAKKVI